MTDWKIIIFTSIYAVLLLGVNLGFAADLQEKLNENITQINEIPQIGNLNSSQIFSDSSSGISYLSALRIQLFTPVNFYANIILVIVPLGLLSIVFYRQIRSGGG